MTITINIHGRWLCLCCDIGAKTTFPHDTTRFWRRGTGVFFIRRTNVQVKGTIQYYKFDSRFSHACLLKKKCAKRVKKRLCVYKYDAQAIFPYRINGTHTNITSCAVCLTCSTCVLCVFWLDAAASEGGLLRKLLLSLCCCCCGYHTRHHTNVQTANVMCSAYMFGNICFYSICTVYCRVLHYIYSRCTANGLKPSWRACLVRACDYDYDGLLGQRPPAPCSVQTMHGQNKLAQTKLYILVTA